MTTGELVFQVLNGDATVAALVGNRIYPNVATEGSAMPFIVYTVVSEVPENSFTGSAATRALNSRVQIDCYARATEAAGGAYKQAHALSDVVGTVIDAQTKSGGTFDAWKLDERDLYDDETSYHRVSADYSLWK